MSDNVQTVPPTSDAKDLRTWSIAELIGARDLARMFFRWPMVAEFTAELRRRGFSA